MRIIMIAADVVMGMILGLFLYAGASTLSDSLRNPVAAVPIFTASLLIVLFRRPNGSLARRGGREPEE